MPAEAGHGRDWWDRRYMTHEGHPFGTEPDPLVHEVASAMPPGDALDLGAGDGRNAVWLLDAGWRVTAVDFSPVALSHLIERSWGINRDAVAIRADLRTWRPHADSADLVILSFVHLPVPARRELLRAAVEAVRSGGRLVLLAAAEVASPKGPDDPALLPSLSEITEDLDGLTIDRADIVTRTIDGDPPSRDLIAVAHR